MTELRLRSRLVRVSVPDDPVRFPVLSILGLGNFFETVQTRRETDFPGRKQVRRKARLRGINGINRLNRGFSHGLKQIQ